MTAFPPATPVSNRTSLISGQKIWCPLCNDYVEFLRIQNAARLVEVNRRTIYRHLEDGSIHAFRVGGSGYWRVCSGCLLSEHSGSRKNEPSSNTKSKVQKQRVT